MIKVLIVDHQLIFRESLKIVIERDQEIQVIGSCGDGREALDLCDRQKPDIVLMDISMPGCDGVEGTRLIKSKYQDMKILILTISNEDSRVTEALRYGADGYVLKDISPDNFILAIKSVAQGLVVIHKQIMNKITTRLEETFSLEYIKSKSLDSTLLSGREIQVIRLITQGQSNREIAEKVYLSEGSVKNMITRMNRKLGLEDRIQLAIYAVKNELI